MTLTTDDQHIFQDVLTFWFQESSPEQWFVESPDFDEKIRERFLGVYEQAAQGQFDHWSQNPQATLALVIILDQFPRNLFRGDKKTYATDEKVLNLTKHALQEGFDTILQEETHKHFLYMPLMHSENVADQDRSVQLFQENKEALKWAQHHRDIVAQFGRFPHRNKILGRDSTPEELAFLQKSDFKT